MLPAGTRRSPAAMPAAEDQVLLGVEYGDLGGALRGLSPEFRAVVQASCSTGSPHGGRAAARRAREHREDPAAPGQGADARLAGTRRRWRDGDDHAHVAHGRGPAGGPTSPGALDALQGASVEQHLVACADCRTRVGPLVDAPTSALAWPASRPRSSARPQPLFDPAGPPARAASGSRPRSCSPASPSLRTAWLCCGLCRAGLRLRGRVLAATARVAVPPGRAPGPAGPGRRTAYGPWTDPFETSSAAPYSGSGCSWSAHRHRAAGHLSARLAAARRSCCPAAWFAFVWLRPSASRWSPGAARWIPSFVAAVHLIGLARPGLVWLSMPRLDRAGCRPRGRVAP